MPSVRASREERLRAESAANLRPLHDNIFCFFVGLLNVLVWLYALAQLGGAGS